MPKVLKFNDTLGVLEEVKVVGGTFLVQRPLVGIMNGVNKTFTTLEYFVPDTIMVIRNGVRQHHLATGDFSVYESGGFGTGYDMVIFESGLEPILGEKLFADYVTP
jgi:hypothetical protein